jgi:hypothetical protein
VNLVKTICALAAAATAMTAPAQMGELSSAGVNLDYLPILMLNPKVVKDLHLSPAVASQEEQLIVQIGMKMLPALQQQGQGAGSREQMMHKMLGTFQEMSQKSVEPLNSAQRARYHQLTLQYYGPAALAFPSVASKVGLTAAQKEKISTILSANGQEMMGHVPHGSGQNMVGQMGAVRKSSNEARAKTDRQVDAILTPAQKAKWAAMQGPKLDGISDMGGLGSMFGG